MSGKRGVGVAATLYFAAYVLIGTLGGSVGPTLGPFAAQVGIGLSSIGVMLTIRSLGYLAGALASTRIVDRVRIHRGLAVAAAIVAGALALLPLPRTLGFLLVLVVPLGFATAALDIGVSTMIVRGFRDRAAPYVSALHFFYGAGGLIAPFLIAAFAVGQETSAYRVLAVGFAALALAFLAVPATGRLQEPVAPREPGESTVGRRFMAATSVILLYVGAEIGFASWLYEFVNLRFAARTATAVTGTFWAAFTVSRLAGVLAARRWSAHQILSATLAAGLAFTLVLVLAPGARLAVWIGAVGFGAAVGPIYPNVITSYAQRFPLTGRRFGAIAVASCTGSMIFPWLIGRLLDLGGTAVVPAVTGGLLAATALAAWAVFRAQPREKLSERG